MVLLLSSKKNEKRIEQMSIMIDNIIKKRNLHKSSEFVEINTDIDEMEM